VEPGSGELAAFIEMFRSFTPEEEALGIEHPKVAASLRALAAAWQERGEHGRVEALLRDILALQETRLGAEHPSCASTLDQLARVEYAREKYGEAEATLRRAIALHEKSLGPDHPRVASDLVTLGTVLAEEGRDAEGEPLIERALGIMRAAHGPDHPEEAQGLAVLAQLQAKMGKPEARDTARRALDALSTSLGPDHPVTRGVAPVLRLVAGTGADAAGVVAQLREGEAALDARDPRRAAGLLSQAADRAREAGLPALEGSARGMLAQALFLLGARDQALGEARQALAVAEEIGQQDAVEHFRKLVQHMEAAPGELDADALVHVALEQMQGGDMEGAKNRLLRIAEQARAAGARGAEATTRIFLGQILLALEEHALAAAELRTALGIAESLGDETAVAHVHSLLERAES
jgi:tetratricopeptide (TPR) repeat protein